MNSLDGAVERVLQGAKGLKPLVALTLFDDAERVADIYSRTENAFGRSGSDILKKCNEGAHTTFGGDMVMLVRDAEKLARWLQKQ